jgi:hypothetical protein
LRSCWNPVHSKTCLKTAEPESGRKKLERAENVPEQGLIEAIILDRARTGRWATETVGMMRCEDDVLANRFDGDGKRCF